MPRYEVYRTNERTGDKKRIGDVTANNKAQALKKISQMATVRKGKYLVIPVKVRSTYTIVKR